MSTKERAAEGSTWPDGVPAIGTWVRLVRGTVTDEVVAVMAAIGGYVQVRPLAGGCERDARPGELRPLTPREELSGRLAVRRK